MADTPFWYHWNDPDCWCMPEVEEDGTVVHRHVTLKGVPYGTYAASRILDGPPIL